MCIYIYILFSSAPGKTMYNSEEVNRRTILQQFFSGVPESALTMLSEEVSDRNLRRVAYKLIHWEEKCHLFKLECQPEVEDIRVVHKDKPFMQR